MKQVASNIGVMLISTVMALAIVEGVLRVIGYHPSKELQKDRELILRRSPVKERIYEATPNAEGYAWGTYVKINSYGFRDKEYDTLKHSDTYRIIVLGDSIAFGNRLALEKILSKQLESLFEKEKRNVEVMNLALGGYDTLQEVSTLEDTGIQFDPDLVVLAYCINDIVEASPNLRHIEQVERYRGAIYRIRVAQLLASKLDQAMWRTKAVAANRETSFRSKNEEYIVEIGDDDELNRLVNILRTDMERADDLHWTVKSYTSMVHLGKLRYSLERLKLLKDKYGFQVITVIIPFLLEKRGDSDIYQTVYRMVECESNRLGFDVMNVHAPLKGAGFRNVLIDGNDGIHPNAIGHKLMASRLYQYIVRKEWGPGS